MARSILGEGHTDGEWADIESDDMFQEGPYVGGCDAIEEAFPFSYYADDSRKYWFQLRTARRGVSAGPP